MLAILAYIGIFWIISFVFKPQLSHSVLTIICDYLEVLNLWQKIFAGTKVILRYSWNSIPGVPIEHQRVKGGDLPWSRDLLLSTQTVYCNFHRKVRLGGWGTEGPKALTLGQYVRVRAPPFR